MSCSIFNINPIVIPKELNLRRREPRKVTMRNSNYEREFDYQTFAYDVFQSDHKVIFSGPPIDGYEDILNNGIFFINGHLISNDRINLEKLDRTCRLWIDFDVELVEFTLFYKGFRFTAEKKANPFNLKNKKVLLTHSKNTNFKWMKGWLNFYKLMHKIDTVVIYDNDSDKYSVQDLKNEINGIDLDIIIVPWKFKPGPLNSPWDSDFSSYGFLEHAKENFLKNVAGVIHVNVNDFLVSKSGENIFDTLKDVAYIKFTGEQVEPIPFKLELENIFSNNFYRSKKSLNNPRKWCINPKLASHVIQWRVNDIANIKDVNFSNNYYYYTYSSVNDDGQNNFLKFDESLHYFDENLFKLMANIFSK